MKMYNTRTCKRVCTSRRIKLLRVRSFTQPGFGLILRPAAVVSFAFSETTMIPAYKIKRRTTHLGSPRVCAWFASSNGLVSKIQRARSRELAIFPRHLSSFWVLSARGVREVMNGDFQKRSVYGSNRFRDHCSKWPYSVCITNNARTLRGPSRFHPFRRVRGRRRVCVFYLIFSDDKQ